MFINQTPSAAAYITGGEDAPRIHGKAEFFPSRDGTYVSVHVTGLPNDGFFALHIHEGADCGGDAFADTGAHFDLTESSHPFHSGDLPPLLSCGEYASMTVFTNRFTVADVIGRTVVIHSDPDDFHTQPSGNAGKKIACGVVRRSLA